MSNAVIIIKNTNCKYRVGIIDTSLSSKHDNVVYNENANFSSNINTHGDEMINFLFDCQENVDLYYFDATNEDGLINTDKLIEGLDWMTTNSVKRVNLSLSNRIKHNELETWILKHDEIEVYASYNNKINSLDYPAMYEGVYASGSDSRIKYKDLDFKYTSNRILILSNVFKIFNGNSYLSVLSMLKK
jgi:hypothetical protein